MNFRDEYQKKVSEIETPKFDSVDIMERAKREKVIAFRRKKRITAIVTAASLFIVCGVGTGAAVSYSKSQIWVDEQGFKTADLMNAKSNMIEDSADSIDGVEEAMLEADRSAAVVGEDISEDQQIQGQEELLNGTEDVAMIESEIMESVDYASKEELLATGVTMALPDSSLMGEITEDCYSTLGEMMVMARIYTEKGFVFFQQNNYEGTSGHASSTAYPEGVTNERTYLTTKGFYFTLIDSIQTEGEPLRIHATASIGDYELVVDFEGYTEAQVKAMLDSMELEVYLK